MKRHASITDRDSDTWVLIPDSVDRWIMASSWRTLRLERRLAVIAHPEGDGVTRQWIDEQWGPTASIADQIVIVEEEDLW